MTDNIINITIFSYTSQIWATLQKEPFFKEQLVLAESQFCLGQSWMTFDPQKFTEQEAFDWTLRILNYMESNLRESKNKYMQYRGDELYLNDFPSFIGSAALEFHQNLTANALDVIVKKQQIILKNDLVTECQKLLKKQFQIQYLSDIEKLIICIQSERLQFLTSVNKWLIRPIPELISKTPVAFPTEVVLIERFQEKYEVAQTILTPYQIWLNAFKGTLASPSKFFGKFSYIAFLVLGVGVSTLLRKYAKIFLNDYPQGLSVIIILSIIIFVLVFYKNYQSQNKLNETQLEAAWKNIREVLGRGIRDSIEESRRKLKDTLRLNIARQQQDWYRTLKDTFLVMDLSPVYDKHIRQVESFKNELKKLYVPN